MTIRRRVTEAQDEHFPLEQNMEFGNFRRWGPIGFNCLVNVGDEHTTTIFSGLKSSMLLSSVG